ncbi:MAG: phage holin family protein [Gammaproteobacteria bacterium]
MEEDKKLGITELISNLSSSAVRTSKDMLELAKTEAKWSVRHLLSILLFSGIFHSFLIITWLCFCGVIVITLLDKQYSLIFSFSVITGVNLTISLLLGLYLVKLKNEIAFLPATIRQMKNIFGRNKDASHE